MIAILTLIFAPLLLAILYRCRGGLFQRYTGIDLGDTKSRILFWAIPIALICWLNGLFWGNALVVGTLAFVTLTFGNFHAIDLGTKEGSLLRDTLMLTLKGFLQGFIPALGFLFTDICPWPLIVFSSLMAGCYWLGKFHTWNIKGFGQNGDFPEVGELYYGFVFGIGLALTFII